MNSFAKWAESAEPASARGLQPQAAAAPGVPVKPAVPRWAPTSTHHRGGTSGHGCPRPVATPIPRPLVTARPPDPSFLRVMMDRAVFILCKNCESASEVWVPVPARPCLGAAGPEMRGAAGGGRGAAAGAPWPGPSWGPAGRPCRPHPSCRRSWEGPAAGSSGPFALPSRGRGRAGKEPRLDPCQAQTMTGENEVETLPTARSSFSTGESVPPAMPLSPLPGGARADGRAPAPGRRQPGPHERSRPTQRLGAAELWVPGRAQAACGGGVAGAWWGAGGAA